MGDFKRDYGRDFVIGYISLWLIDLNDTANVKSKMSDAQIEGTAERIYEGYSLKVTDLTLFFRNVKDGVYGQYYENLDRSKILDWLAIYFENRCETAEGLAQNSGDGFNPVKDKVNPEVIKAMFNGVGEVKVTHEVKGAGIGSRQKAVINADLITSIKTKTTPELREYLLSHDSASKNYDEFIYGLVEKELDLRNTLK